MAILRPAMAPGEQASPNAAGARSLRGQPVRNAFWLPLRVGSALWLLDAATLFEDKLPVHWAPTLLGLFGALFVTLCISAVAGLVLAAARWLALSPAQAL